MMNTKLGHGSAKVLALPWEWAQTQIRKTPQTQDPANTKYPSNYMCICGVQVGFP